MNSTHRGSVLVTGASSGIGRATALLLAHHDFVVYAGVRKEADGRTLREGAANASVRPVRIDVTDPESIAAASRSVSEATAGAGLAGLVNNAGIGVAGPIEYLPISEIRREMEINVLGAIATTQAFLPLLRLASGRLVNLGSVGDRFTPPFGGVTSASKSALRSFTEALRMELRPWGIQVCLIEPASISTPAVEKVSEDAERLLASLPPEGVRRYGTMFRSFLKRAVAQERGESPPEAVAAVVLRALTDQSPKTRYAVGKNSFLLRNLPRLLPDRALDFARMKVFSLPTGFGALSEGRDD